MSGGATSQERRQGLCIVENEVVRRERRETNFVSSPSNRFISVLQLAPNNVQKNMISRYTCPALVSGGESLAGRYLIQSHTTNFRSIGTGSANRQRPASAFDQSVFQSGGARLKTEMLK